MGGATTATECADRLQSVAAARDNRRQLVSAEWFLHAAARIANTDTRNVTQFRCCFAAHATNLHLRRQDTHVTSVQFIEKRWPSTVKGTVGYLTTCAFVRVKFSRQLLINGLTFNTIVMSSMLMMLMCSLSQKCHISNR